VRFLVPCISLGCYLTLYFPSASSVWVPQYTWGPLITGHLAGHISVGKSKWLVYLSLESPGLGPVVMVVSCCIWKLELSFAYSNQIWMLSLSHGLGGGNVADLLVFWGIIQHQRGLEIGGIVSRKDILLDFESCHHLFSTRNKHKQLFIVTNHILYFPCKLQYV